MKKHRAFKAIVIGLIMCLTHVTVSTAYDGGLKVDKTFCRDAYEKGRADAKKNHQADLRTYYILGAFSGVVPLVGPLCIGVLSQGIPVKVPENKLDSYSSQYRKDYASGYKQYVKVKKGRNILFGGMISSVLIFGFVYVPLLKSLLSYE